MGRGVAKILSQKGANIVIVARNKQKLDELLPPVSQDSKYLVCGPPPMTNALTKALTDLGCDAPKQFKHATDQVFVF